MTDIDHEWAKRHATDLPENDPCSFLARAYLDMRARNERLREALAPFSGIIAHDADDLHDDASLTCRWPVTGAKAYILTLGDLRRARQAYEEGGR